MSNFISALPKSLRIGTRLGLSFGAVIFLMLCIVVLSLATMGNMSKTTHHIIEQEWGKTEAAATLSAMAALNARRTVQQLVSTEQERQHLRQEILLGREQFVNAFKYLTDTVNNPDALALLAKAELSLSAVE